MGLALRQLLLIAVLRGTLGDLFQAARDGDAARVQQLVHEGADVNMKDKYGKTPLHRAVWDGHEKTVQILLDAGAHVNLKDKYGWTPLHLAASSGHEKTVQILLDAGADVNAKDEYGKTPLHRAARWGYEKTVQILLDAGAHVNLEDKHGNTALHLAVKNEWGEKTVQILLDEGASINTEDFPASLRYMGCNVILAKGFLAHHKVTELPTSAATARACALRSMSFGEKLSMAAGEPRTYEVPAAALAVAFLAVAVEACVKSAQRGQHVPLPTTDCEPEASDFLKGARIQVAKARTEGKGLKLAFRALEVVVNGSLFGGMAMIMVWWPVWLAILAASFVLPAACQYGLPQVVQVPALAIATTESRSWRSLLRVLVLVGLTFYVVASLNGPGRTVANPLANDIWITISQVWRSRTLSDDVEALPLLPKQYTAWAESLRCASAQSIFACFLCLQVVCLLVYIIALLVQSVREACRACFHTATATEHGNEPGPTLARQLAKDGFVKAVQDKLRNKLTKVQWEQQHCFDVDALKIKVCFMALDVLLDTNTIFSLLVSRNYKFAACLTFVVARSTTKQLSNLKGFKKALDDSARRGLLHAVVLHGFRAIPLVVRSWFRLLRRSESRKPVVSVVRSGLEKIRALQLWSH